jgi:hypothetical protein
MTLSVAVVIPALDEEAMIAASIASARTAGVREIIVVDGGSRDATIATARAAGAHVIESAPIRGKQLNDGAKSASSEAIIFLHADTLLPENAAHAVSGAIESGYEFGGFRLRFLEKSRRLRFVANMINLRTTLTLSPWGDQAQFITRAAFENVGGYREIAIMEDYDLAQRMRRRGKSILLPHFIETSGRRFLTKGIVATTARNWRIVASYRLGVDPERLARMYRA